MISGLTTRYAPPEAVPDDDADGFAVRLREGVDRRVRADERGVERAAEDRLDGVGSGVEGRELERHVVAERVLDEVTVLTPTRAGAWVTFGK